MLYKATVLLDRDELLGVDDELVGPRLQLLLDSREGGRAWGVSYQTKRGPRYDFLV